MAPNPHLIQFLATEDLDDLLDVTEDLGALASEDENMVRTILLEWRDEQGVSNLLIHSSLIPTDVRLSSLLRGLHEQEQPYFVLAAVVGVQSLQPAELAAADRIALRDRLLEIVSLDDEVIAERATISLPTVLTESDGALVCRQLEHPNETVRHNLLSWLVTTFDPERSAALESLLDASVLSSGAIAQIKEQVAAYVRKRHAKEFNPLRGPLLTYIPNLSDTQ